MRKEPSTLRNTLYGILMLLVLAALVVADEIKGKVVTVDLEKGAFKLSEGGKGDAYTVIIDRDTKIVDPQGKEIEGGLKGKSFEKGKAVLVKYEKKDEATKTISKVNHVVVNIKFP